MCGQDVPHASAWTAHWGKTLEVLRASTLVLGHRTRGGGCKHNMQVQCVQRGAQLARPTRLQCNALVFHTLPFDLSA